MKKVGNNDVKGQRSQRPSMLWRELETHVGPARSPFLVSLGPVESQHLATQSYSSV